MKITKLEKVPAREKTVVVKIQCDICGSDTRDETAWSDNGDHSSVNETTVEMRVGDNYGSYDGGSIKTTTFDICTDCFEEKLIPWMDGNGAKPEIEEYDW